MTSQKLIDSPNHGELTAQTPERVVLLRRPVFWSYIFASVVVGAGIGLGAWAAIARFDQTIPATGQLELQGGVKDIKAPGNGVIQEILVKDGEAVEENEPLATFKSTIAEADLESLKKEKDALTKENQFYEEVLKGGNPTGESDLTTLIQLRTDLAKETQYYQTLVTDKNLEVGAGGEFNANQQKLLAASSPELQSRAAAARLQIQEVEKQQSQVKEKLAAAQKLLAVNQDILDQLTQASREVTVPQQQYQRQKQEVLNNQEAVDKLKTEQQRLTGEMTQAKQELQNAIALSTKDVLTRITENQKRIAQIDSQLKQAQLENQQRIAAIDTDLNQASNPQGQQLTSPVEGVVFDLQPSAPGYVANANQTLMTIVPNDSLVASVFLKDKDIGFVKPGMNVEVTIASFPKSELGNLRGKLVWIGSDVLPPTPEHPYYAFPARVQLDHPSLQVNGQPLRLQSGMPVKGNIILADQLTVLDVLQDKFEKKFRGVVEFVQ